MNKSTPVVNVFVLLCIAVSIPSAFSTTFFDLFSGELPHNYWWQNFSMAFQHGARGIPMAIVLHLALNLVLLLTCGRFTERLVGSQKFLLLSIIAWIGFVLTQKISGIWINGSSGIIWAYSPFLLYPIKLQRENKRHHELVAQARLMLVVMWGIVTLAMGFIPLLFNSNLKLIHSFFFGNLFHASATLVGFVLYYFWQKNISLSNIPDNLLL